MKLSRTALAAASIAVLTTAPCSLSAQERETSIYAKCAQIADDAERLACFDATYAREETLLAEKAEAERLREIEDFGLTPAQIAEREEREREEGAARRAEIEREADDDARAALADSEQAPAEELEDNDDDVVTARVSEVLKDALGNYVVLLDNGQIWRSTSNKSFRGRIRSGWKAEVEEIWSGGYRMRFDEKRGFLGVKRMR